MFCPSWSIIVCSMTSRNARIGCGVTWSYFHKKKKTKRLDALHGQVNRVNIFTFSAANFFGEIREFRWDFSFSCTFSNG